MEDMMKEQNVAVNEAAEYLDQIPKLSLIHISDPAHTAGYGKIPATSCKDTSSRGMGGYEGMKAWELSLIHISAALVK